MSFWGIKALIFFHVLVNFPWNSKAKTPPKRPKHAITQNKGRSVVTKTAKAIVVGAGPVGSVAAWRLAEMGVDVILLEAHPDCPEDLRASTLHPPTLEMLNEFGIVDDLIEMGLKAPVYQYRNRQSGETFAFDLTELQDMTDYPYRLQCEQFKLARLLTAKLADHPNGEVLFSRRVLTVEQDGSGVTLKVETTRDIETYRADFVIACDGACGRSQMRRGHP